jgi:phosphatidylserine decarboxylase
LKIESLIVKDAYIYIAVFALLTVLTAVFLNPHWSIVPGVLTLYMVFFFRNPRRYIELNARNILSPADGNVMSIIDGFEEKFLNGEGTKITIFLSVFDVHVNRSPIAGEIKYQEYCCGRFRPAYKDSVGFVNERHTLGIENDNLRIMVTQIAGV